VPPTRGVFKGGADSELEVAVRVSTAAAPVIAEPLLPASGWAALDYGSQA
jgi:hypothetical protein